MLSVTLDFRLWKTNAGRHRNISNEPFNINS